jgi:hypothetical protein
MLCTLRLNSRTNAASVSEPHASMTTARWSCQKKRMTDGKQRDTIFQKSKRKIKIFQRMKQIFSFQRCYHRLTRHIPARKCGNATVDERRDMYASVSALQLVNETDSSTGVADNDDDDDDDIDAAAAAAAAAVAADVDDDTDDLRPLEPGLRRYMAKYAALICVGDGSGSTGGTAAAAAVSERQRVNAWSRRAAFSDLRFTKSCVERIGRQIWQATNSIIKTYAFVQSKYRFLQNASACIRKVTANLYYHVSDLDPVCQHRTRLNIHDFAKCTRTFICACANASVRRAIVPHSCAVGRKSKMRRHTASENSAGRRR